MNCFDNCELKHIFLMRIRNVSLRRFFLAQKHIFDSLIGKNDNNHLLG